MVGGDRIGVGIDSFAYHRHFGETTRWETPSEVRWSTGDFLDRADALGVDSVSLQTAYLPELTPDAIAVLKGELAARGLAAVLAWGHPDGLQGGASPERVAALRRLLPAAAALGCPVVRLVCGNQFTWVLSKEERIGRLAPILRDLAAEAAAFGLTLAVENHADFAMRDLVGLVEAVGSERLGICFDTGNAARVGDDLLEVARVAAPHVRMVHIKDMIMIEASRGDPTAWWPSAPLGRGHLDIPGFVGVLADAGFAGTLFVEMANMHPDFADEDAAVGASVTYLRDVLDGRTVC
jgi:sugar phosphate isomerase/epimerase